MCRFLIVTLALVVLVLPDRYTRADPIRLLSFEGGVQSSVGGVTPQVDMPLSLNYSSQGGSVEFIGGALTPDTSSGGGAYADQQHAINAPFTFNLGAQAPGSTDTVQGPFLSISGTVTGTLTGPGAGGVAWRWSGGYTGTATSASLDPFHAQDASELPAPLLDILNHPDHFHINVFVGGGDRNELDVTLTFDPPAPNEVAEPTALWTLVVGSAGLIVRRRMRRAATEPLCGTGQGAGRS